MALEVAETNKDQTQQQQQNDDIEMRLPDTALRQIFSYLKFNDIKSCRLISKQWLRHSLDHTNFILSVEIEPKRRRQRSSTSAADALEANRYRILLSLVPYPAMLSQSSIREKIRRKKAALPRVKATKPSKLFYFRDLAFQISNGFQHKIKHVILKNANPVLSSVLDSLKRTTPEARSVYATDFEESTRKVIWDTQFFKEQRSGDFKCSVLDINSSDAGSTLNSVVRRLFVNDADFIETLNVQRWWPVQWLLSRLESNNDNEALVLINCRELRIEEESRLLTVAPFRSIAAHFPYIERLRCEIGENDPAADIEHLEQLANLKSLTICNRLGLQREVLPNLRLPSLTELCLGSDVLLPEDPNNVVMPELKTLELEAGLQNSIRLADVGAPILSNLTALTVTITTMPNLIVPFMRNILPETTKLQKLRAAHCHLSVDQLRILSGIYDILVTVQYSLPELTFGIFWIPDVCNWHRLLQALLFSVVRRNLKTTVTIIFNDNASKGLINALIRWAIRRRPVRAGGKIAYVRVNFQLRCYKLAWTTRLADGQQPQWLRQTLNIVVL